MENGAALMELKSIFSGTCPSTRCTRCPSTRCTRCTRCTSCTRTRCTRAPVLQRLQCRGHVWHKTPVRRFEHFMEPAAKPWLFPFVPNSVSKSPMFPQIPKFLRPFGIQTLNFGWQTDDNITRYNETKRRLSSMAIHCKFKTRVCMYNPKMMVMNMAITLI